MKQKGPKPGQMQPVGMGDSSYSSHGQTRYCNNKDNNGMDEQWFLNNNSLWTDSFRLMLCLSDMDLAHHRARFVE